MVDVVGNGDVLEANIRRSSVDADAAVEIADSQVAHCDVVRNDRQADAVGVAIAINSKAIALYHHAGLSDGVLCFGDMISKRKVVSNRDALVDVAHVIAGSQQYRTAAQRQA